MGEMEGLYFRLENEIVTCQTLLKRTGYNVEGEEDGDLTPQGLSDKYETTIEMGIAMITLMKQLEHSLGLMRECLPAIPVHSAPDQPSDAPTAEGRAIPKPGDKVLCKWGDWQFFDSTIISFDQAKMEYYIEWDDQDPTGRHIPIKHLAVNRPPAEDEIGIGTMVLFHQGRYGAAADIGRLAGVRWHQGKITKITTDGSGQKLYSGCHTKGEEDGKWVTYKDYCYTFHDYKLDELRCAPNIFDILQNNTTAQENTANVATHCDVYLSYCPSDSSTDVKNGLATAHSDSATYATMTDPLQIIKDLESKGYKVLSNIRNPHNRELDLNKIVSCIKNCKLFVSCISDDYANNENCRMEIQYAKKTARKNLIPVIVGSGGYDWQATVVGMLIAGERYIDFRKKENYDEKLDDLKIQVENLMVDATGNPTAGPTIVKPVDKKQDIFISYCWSNSYLSKQNNEVQVLSGNAFNDPRRIKALLEKKYKVWLDIEQLTSGQVTGMFEQITSGLLNSKCVCAFVSSEYARSENCKMEFQFATKSLRKPFIPICVGNDMGWESSVIGALVMGGGQETVNLLNLQSEAELSDKIEEIMSRVSEHVGGVETSGADEDADSECEEAAPPAYADVVRRAPQVGDHVISHHFKHAYFTATILSFNPDDMTYYIEWDDGDPSGRTQKYNMVALNDEPDDDDLGVGERVFFPQGEYGGSEGNNTGGMRYHEGVITGVTITDGKKYYNGEHTRGEADGKWVTWRGYEKCFSGMTTRELRVAPNAMDALYTG